MEVILQRGVLCFMFFKCIKTSVEIAHHEKWFEVPTNGKRTRPTEHFTILESQETLTDEAFPKLRTVNQRILRL